MSTAVWAAASGEADALAAAEQAVRWTLGHRRRDDGSFAHGDHDIGGPYLSDSLEMARALLPGQLVGIVTAPGDRRDAEEDDPVRMAPEGQGDRRGQQGRAPGADQGAGDAAHLNPPFGGHGLNTGIGFVTQDSNLFPWATAVATVSSSFSPCFPQMISTSSSRPTLRAAS